MPYERRGILLEQNKEPALSRPLRCLVDTEDPDNYFSPPRDAAEPITTAAEYIRLLQRARIIDEHDGRMLADKLSEARQRGVVCVLVDALDDQPYISSQMGPALQLADELADGLALALTITGASRGSVQFYRHLPDIETKIPPKLGPFPTERVGGRYPAEARALAPRGKEQTLVVGACALIHLSRAVRHRRRQLSCFVTVAGNCAADPANYEVPIGLSIAELIERCGIIDTPKRVVTGGSMTGRRVLRPREERVGVLTRGVILFNDEYNERNAGCIGCGRCTALCPQGLSPSYITRMILAGKRRRVAEFHLERCVGCGICSYICPVRIDIPQIIAAELARRDAQEEA